MSWIQMATTNPANTALLTTTTTTTTTTRSGSISSSCSSSNSSSSASATVNTNARYYLQNANYYEFWTITAEGNRGVPVCGCKKHLRGWQHHVETFKTSPKSIKDTIIATSKRRDEDAKTLQAQYPNMTRNQILNTLRKRRRASFKTFTHTDNRKRTVRTFLFFKLLLQTYYYSYY